MTKAMFGLLLTLIITFSCSHVQPLAEKGVLDLRSYDFKNNKAVKLDGEWEFYWKELYSPDYFNGKRPDMTGFIEVPSTWNGQIIGNTKLSHHGYATYRLTILLPENCADQLELEVIEINSSYKLFVNGNALVTRGIVGKNWKESKPEWQNALLNIDSSTKKIELIIQTSNFDFITGGMAYRSFKLAEGSYLSEKKQRAVAQVTFLFTLLIFLGTINLLFFITGKRDKAYLWLSLYCLSFAMAILTSDEKGLFLLFFENNYELVTTLAHFPNRCGLMLILLYLYSIFPNEVEKRILKGVTVFFSLSTIFVILTPARIYSYGMYLNILSNFLLAGYITLVFCRAVLRKREGAYIFIASWSFVLLTIVIESLGIFEQIILANILSLSVVFFLIGHTIMLSIRFSRALSDSEHLTEHLTAINNLKDDFLAKTSHEFRTPLHAIMGIAQSMIDDSETQFSSHERSNLEMIIQSSKRLSFLVNDILDFYKIKHSTLTLQQKPVNIYAIANTTIALVRFLYASKDVKIINDIPHDLEAIYADEYRVQQIILNLLENSLKNTIGGEVVIKGVKEKKYLRITVTDSGRGIAGDDLENVFHMFEQANGEKKRQNGTGIGLPITKQLVELHGGRISLYSTLGVGTTISFTLPIYTGNEQAITLVSSDFITTPEELVEDQLNENRKGTILIVDDEPSNIQVVKNFINQLNYNFRIVLTGEEALKLVKEEGPSIDLVILDLMMPDISGYEVCRELRKTYSLYELPVLIVTAKIREVDIVAGFEAGANDYLTKPFDKDEFLSRVKTLLKLRNVLNINMDLERSSEMKHLFLSMLSHDIRHPLYIFKITLENMLEGRIDSEQYNSLLKELYLEAINLEEMALRFLELTRIKNGQDSIVKTDFNPFKELKSIVEKNRLKAESKGQKLLLSIKSNLTTNIRADKAQFNSIFNNIISNAIKYSPKSEEIRIKVDIRNKDGLNLLVEVKDKGPGMKELDEMEVFKSFATLNSLQTTKEPSAGIGLYIVKHLLDLHNGRIYFKDNPGGGATVTIELPITP